MKKKILIWTGNQYEEIEFDKLPVNKNIAIKIVEEKEGKEEDDSHRTSLRDGN